MKDIEQLLRDNTPEIPDEGQFLIETNARLDAVEGIKKTVDGERRRWRTALIVTLVAGLIAGSLVTLLLTFYPVQPLDNSALARVVDKLQSWKEVFWGLIAACTIALAVVFMTKRREVVL